MPSVRALISRPVRVAKKLAKRAIGLVPPPRARLAGTLAKDGGIPVRDTRFRPWPNYPAGGVLEWKYKVSPSMGRVFRSGVEGLPQPLAMEFAQKWAEYCGARYALLLPHGTDALRIALAATLDHDGLEYGGEIIVPNLSFIASANAALDRRIGVALVDVDADTLNVDPRRVEEAIIPGRTCAIMAVHLFGQPVDMTSLRAIAQRHSLAIIEDAAQAHGAIHELGRAGAIGDAAGFSFQSAKNLTAGEGGAFTTSNAKIFERACALHNVGRVRIGGERWSHETLGWNCRASEYVAAVLLHRLGTFEAEQQWRYTRFLLLRQELAGITCVQPLGLGLGVQRHAVHMFVMRYRAEHCGGLDLEGFLQALRAEGVPVGRCYEKTLAQQPALQRVKKKHPEYVRVLPTPVADQAAKDIIYLPHHLFLGTKRDMSEIAAAFRKIEAHYNVSRQRHRPATRQQSSPPATSVPSADLNADITVAERPIRVGIIGIGFMGQEHAAATARNSKTKLVAIVDAQPQLAQDISAKLGCKWFSSADDLMRSGAVDAIVIATPHWQHADMAIAALRAGLHVLCEKPFTVTVAQADEVLQAAKESGRMLAVVHQRRFEPVYQYTKTLLESGELGSIYRCSIVETTWRSAAYYRSSAWRGTWKGEGGGVLLNQGPHVVDRYVWLCGMPDTVAARCDTNLHEIETEDTVSAILHHREGTHGHIYISTVECPATSRTVIGCDRGRVTIENGKVRVTTLRDSIRNQTAVDKRLWGDLDSESREVPASELPTYREPLDAFYDNVAAALHGAAPLQCGGETGRNTVELINAMLLSSARASAIHLPLKREEYTDFIMSMINCSTRTGDTLSTINIRQRRDSK